MKSLIKEQITEIDIKKSRFICHLKKVDSEQEAKDYIAELKQQHPTAAHHCSAYRIGSIERANDDGEPSQTAGMPMLNVLSHNQMYNTVAVVVRYFGGIKLGAGGLVRAYSDSVVAALEEAQIANLAPGYAVQIKASYSDIDKLNYILKQEQVDDYEVKYEANVIYQLQLPVTKYQPLEMQIKNYNHLIKIEVIEEVIVVEG